jgi:2-methylcitrate dehydratase PrpD
MYPKAYPATLIAELKDGRILQAHVDYPKGDPENPATKEEIISKFHSLTSKYLDNEKRDKIISTVNHLEEIKNIAELADLVR